MGKKNQPSEAILKAARANGVFIYYVKYLGNLEVEQAKGASVIDTSIVRLAQAAKAKKEEFSWHPPRVEISISAGGIKLADRTTGEIMADLDLRNVSYVSEDKKENIYFGFIAKDFTMKKCFVFKTEHQASEIVQSIGSAFSQANVKGGFDSPVPERANKSLSTPTTSSPFISTPNNDPFANPILPKAADPFANPILPGQKNQFFEQDDPFANPILPRQNRPASQRMSFDDGDEEIDREMQELERDFEADFKFAKARAESQHRHTDPRSARLEEEGAFRSSNKPQAHGSLRPLDPAAFESVTTPSNGFGDQFAPHSPQLFRAPPPTTTFASPSDPFAAMFSAPPPTNPQVASPFGTSSQPQNRQANPHARVRGAPPPLSQLAPQTTSTSSKLPPPPGVSPQMVRKQGPSGPSSNLVVSTKDADPFSSLPAPPPSRRSRSLKSKTEDDEISSASLSSPPQRTQTSLNTSLNTSDEFNEAEIDALVEALEAEHHSLNMSSESIDDKASPPSAPTIADLCSKVFESAHPDAEGYVSGGALRPVLMASKVDVSVLVSVWNLVDTSKLGKINYKQLAYALGLLSQAQRNESLNMAAVGPSTPPPHLEGY